MKIRTLAQLMLLPLLSLPIGGCGTTAGNRNDQCRPLAPPDPALKSAVASSPFQGSVFTIVMENKSASDILKPGGPAYINSLAQQYAVAGGYTDSFVHPSEPNYLWMVAGENFGVLSDGDPSSNHVASTSHLADQLDQAGITWRSYQESMGQPCGVTGNGLYEPKHDPFVYFDDVNGWNGTTFTRPQRCLDHVVDYSQFAVDLQSGKLPKYVFITPNMQDDMHDGSIADGDRWLSQEVPKILASPAWQNGGVLFLMWDEGTLQSDDPPMIVISPLAKRGFVSSAPYETSSYLKTVQALVGVEALPCDPTPDQVPMMDDLFSVPLPNSAAAPTTPPAAAVPASAPATPATPAPATAPAAAAPAATAP
jgi:hypothetical protein